MSRLFARSSVLDHAGYVAPTGPRPAYCALSDSVHISRHWLIEGAMRDQAVPYHHYMLEELRGLLHLSVRSERCRELVL